MIVEVRLLATGGWLFSVRVSVEGCFTVGSWKSKCQGLHEHLCCFLEKKKPRKGRQSQDWRERRNAIQLTNEHTVETLVVADADMVQYHGAEAAQRFILTVMNMVSLELGS